MSTLRLFIVSLCAQGCFSANPAGGTLRCDSSNRCPDGYACFAQFCWRSAPPELAMTDLTASPDLPDLVSVNVTVKTVGSAMGTTALSPPPASSGTSCGAQCTTYRYPYGTNLKVTATGTPLFQSWTGDCSSFGTVGSTSGDCTIMLTATRNVTATFRPAVNYVFATSTQYQIGVDIKPSSGGSVTANSLANAACTARAQAAGLSGKFVAWLSNEG